MRRALHQRRSFLFARLCFVALLSLQWFIAGLARVSAEDGNKPAGPEVKHAAANKELLPKSEPHIARTDPPSLTMTLADYLARELGPRRFNRRVQWAGRSGRYEPIVKGRRVWKSVGRVRYLTIHHAEGVPDDHPATMIRLIFNGHTAAGGRLNAADVGYHFFVDRQGRIWEGRDASKLGTHVGSTPPGMNNDGNLGICGLGSFGEETPPAAMVEAIGDLSALIARYYQRSLAVRGHKDWVGIHQFHPVGGVDCPGRLDLAVRIARRKIENALRKDLAATPVDSRIGSRRAGSF
ncbi:N-acetylmuramoyl-L-alanine amidase [Candidatus Sumerlaeota bacterium]|nr:N-acetylmuramoyl-L-alanine amidase [Candidatus Sumerlaeota bacterium]